MGEGLQFEMGRLTTVLPSGLGYVMLDGESRTRPFVVGKALKGYNGRPYESFGLAIDVTLFVALQGADIRFLVPEDERAPAEAVQEMKNLLRAVGNPSAVRFLGKLRQPSERFLKEFVLAHGDLKTGAAEAQPARLAANA